MFPLRVLYAPSQTEKPRPRPMGSGDLACDDRKRSIAPPVPFDAIGVDEHGVGHATPFAHQPRTRLQRDRWRCLSGIASCRLDVENSSLRRIDLERPPNAFSWSLYVIPRINNSRDSRMGGGIRCSRRHSVRSSKIVKSPSRASSTAILIAGFGISATATRLDAVTTDVATQL